MSDQDIRKFSSRGAVRDPNLQVMRNHKPAIEISPSRDPKASVGTPISVSLTGADPDGTPTRFYLWSRDVGTIKGNTYSYTPKGSDRGKTSPSA